MEDDELAASGSEETPEESLFLLAENLRSLTVAALSQVEYSSFGRLVASLRAVPAGLRS